MKLLRIGFLACVPLICSAQGFSAQKPGNDKVHPGQALWPLRKPALGEAAPDFALFDLEGKAFRLKDNLGKRPIVIEFGSYS